MKSLMFIIITAATSILLYFYVGTLDFLQPEHCEEVKKFTYWPVVLNQWNKNDNLRTVKEVLDRLGFKMVNGSKEHWDILWSIEFPFDRFPHLLDNLTMTSTQKINHFPGATVLGNKRHLSTTFESPYILPSFSLPQDAEKFKKFRLENPGKKFVEKFYTNRGVEIVDAEVIENGYKNDDKFLQVFLDNPLLIDGHQFDIGVYVLITSIDPLVIYRFADESLFRFCAEPYHPFDPKNPDKYVIAENKLHAWDMPTFQRLEGHFSFFNAEIFKSHLAKNGHDVEEVWRQFDDAITSVVVSKIDIIRQTIEAECKKYGCRNENFFELFRFDFIIDDELNVHLLEINMSPNLTPAADEYERNRIQYEHVVHSVLRLIGAEGFLEFSDELRSITPPQNIAVDFEECSQCDKNCESNSCMLCLPCMDEKLKLNLHRFYREHHRRGSFKRIFPTAESVDDVVLEKLPELSQKVALWFEAKCAMDENWC